MSSVTNLGSVFYIDAHKRRVCSKGQLGRLPSDVNVNAYLIMVYPPLDQCVGYDSLK